VYQIKNEYTSESESEKPKKMADLAPRKFEGIGPTTKDGMPLILRSVSINQRIGYSENPIGFTFLIGKSP